MAAILSRPQCVKSSPGLGVTKSISSIPSLTLLCHNPDNTEYLLNITFTFDSFRRCSVVVTFVKHKQVTILQNQIYTQREIHQWDIQLLSPLV